MSAQQLDNIFRINEEVDTKRQPILPSRNVNCVNTVLSFISVPGEHRKKTIE